MKPSAICLAASMCVVFWPACETEPPESASQQSFATVDTSFDPELEAPQDIDGYPGGYANLCMTEGEDCRELPCCPGLVCSVGRDTEYYNGVSMCMTVEDALTPTEPLCAGGQVCGDDVGQTWCCLAREACGSTLGVCHDPCEASQGGPGGPSCGPEGTCCSAGEQCAVVGDTGEHYCVNVPLRSTLPPPMATTFNCSGVQCADGETCVPGSYVSFPLCCPAGHYYDERGECIRIGLTMCPDRETFCPDGWACVSGGGCAPSADLL